MNKVFSVIWNQSLGVYVVAPETATGRTKSNVIKKAACLALSSILWLSATANATDVVLSGSQWWTPTPNNNEVGAKIFDTAGAHSLTGQLSMSNVSGAGVLMTYNEAAAAGYVVAPDLSGLQKLLVGPKASSILVADPITGSMRSVLVYASSAFDEVSLGGDKSGTSDVGITVYPPDSTVPYLDFRLATVSAGVLTVDLPSTTINPGVLRIVR